MCLITYMKHPQVAQQDIVCWKILREEQFSHKENLVVTVYRDFAVTLDKEITPHGSPDVRETRMFDNGEQVQCFAVNGGFFHSFVSYQDAVVEADEMLYIRRNFSSKTKLILAECIIPKGTEYYRGTFDGIQSYASRKLFIKGVSENSKTQIL